MDSDIRTYAPHNITHESYDNTHISLQSSRAVMENEEKVKPRPYGPQQERGNDASRRASAPEPFVPRIAVPLNYPFRVLAYTMSENRKQEKDYTKEVDEAISQADKLVKVRYGYAILCLQMLI
jgi:hypothetical protein